MPHFDFKPAVTQVHFYRSQRGVIEDEYVSEVKVKDYSGEGSIDIFELYIDITLSGLDTLTNPMSMFLLETRQDFDESIYEPFYINIVSYTQRGQRDTIIHGLKSIYINEDTLKQGSVNLVSLINKFRNDIPNILPDDQEPVNYDNIEMIYFVKVFYSTEEILSEKQLNEYMWEPYYNLFATKIPVSLPGKEGYLGEQ